MSVAVPFDDWTVYGQWWPTMRRRRQAAASLVHHSVTRTAGFDDLQQARTIEAVIHGRRLKSRFSMVAYNFIIARGATVFEGRGWTYRNGANNDTKRTGYGNANTISICFAGNYEVGLSIPTVFPTDDQLDAAAAIIREGLELGHIYQPALVLPHNHVHATACPGDTLEGRMQDIADRVAIPPQPELPTLPDLEEDLMADPLVMYEDPETETTFMVWRDDAGRIVVFKYGTHRPGSGKLAPGMLWVYNAMIADDKWVAAN